MAQIDTRQLAGQLAPARLALDEHQQRVAIALYRLLAKGQPVSRRQLAQRAGALSGDVEPFVELLLVALRRRRRIASPRRLARLMTNDGVDE